MERLTPLSASFLQAEDEDDRASLAIASVAIFEGPAPTHADFVAHITGRLPCVDRYRQRVRQVPFDLGPPVWVDDPRTDVSWHVRRLAVPSPGDADELNRLVGRIMSQRMDRARPLWEYWVIEGLAGDQWAVIQKVHHCVVDGVSGSELYHVVFDESPETRPPIADTWVAQAAPSTIELTARAVLDLALTPVAAARAVGRLLAAPRSLARHVLPTVRGAAALGTAILPAAPSSLAGPIGQQRRYTATTVAFPDVRLIRSAFPCTVNDVALAAISGGFRALLLSRGEEPHEHAVRSLVPVSVRSAGEEGVLDNRVSLMLPYLPVDVADPVERLQAVSRRIADAFRSGESEAGSSFTAMAVYEPFLPVALGVRLALHVPQRHLVTVTTNVPGPRAPVYALGRRCLRIMPYVPIADRVRIGVAIFSYVDELVFGVTGDYDTSADIEVFARGVSSAVDELVHAATGTLAQTSPMS